MILVFIDWLDWSIKTPNLQLNADIILEIYVSIKKSSPFRGTRPSLCEALCIFIKAVKGIQGWGLRSWGGAVESRGRLSNCLHVNFKLNSPCPGTISALNANHFSGPFVAAPLQTLDCWWKNANHCTESFWDRARRVLAPQVPASSSSQQVANPAQVSSRLRISSGKRSF